MRIPIQFEVEQTTIMGVMHIPEHGIIFRHVAVMCYGFNGYRSEVHRMSVKLGEYLSRNGISLLRLDYRGQGISAGSMENVCLASKVKDISGAIDFVRGCFDDPTLPIDLIGFSDGARVVVAVAETRSICSMILWNPIFETKNTNYSKNEKGRKRNAMFRNEISNQWNYQYYGLPVNISCLQELMESSSFEKFTNIKCRKYCVWGEDDIFTKENRAVVQPHTNAQSIIENAGHLFFGETNERRVFEATYEYLTDIAQMQRSEK